MPNRYLEGVRKNRPKLVKRALLLWVLLITMFLAIWQFLSPTPPSEPRDRAHVDARSTRHHIAGDDDDREVEPATESSTLPVASFVLMVVAFGAILAYSLRRQARLSTRLREADALLLEEEIDGAASSARAILKKAIGQARYQAFVILAQCAERRCDFNEAAEVYGEAATAIPQTLGAGLMRKQLEPIANARRAFVLAAADRLDEAEAIVARPIGAEALPGTLALTVRARAIIDSKRGRYKQLLDGMAASHAVLRDALPLRDRILLRAVVAHARLSIADAHRGTSAPSVLADAELATWIGRVVPRVQPLLEGAS